jgi:hypothetical protein
MKNSHNTPERNLRFKIQFSTSNLQYLLTDPSGNVDQTLVDFHRREIKKAEGQLRSMGIEP